MRRRPASSRSRSWAAALPVWNWPENSVTLSTTWGGSTRRCRKKRRASSWCIAATSSCRSSTRICALRRSGPWSGVVSSCGWGGASSASTRKRYGSTTARTCRVRCARGAPARHLCPSPNRSRCLSGTTVDPLSTVGCGWRDPRQALSTVWATHSAVYPTARASPFRRPPRSPASRVRTSLVCSIAATTASERRLGYQPRLGRRSPTGSGCGARRRRRSFRF
mmetsp:Transcript_21013/g.62721  ORF Transcript_21013/g.62721 Transcript_21013/m.62721 type:complete len:222 (-) Transcript_21013:234-899(-)